MSVLTDGTCLDFLAPAPSAGFVGSAKASGLSWLIGRIALLALSRRLGSLRWR